MTVLSLCGFTQSCYCVIVIDALYYSYLQDPKHVSVTSFFVAYVHYEKVILFSSN